MSDILLLSGTCSASTAVITKFHTLNLKLALSKLGLKSPGNLFVCEIEDV